MTHPTPRPEQVMNALLNGNNQLFVVENIIAAAKAFIHFTNTADLDAEWKYSLHEIEERFMLYTRIWESMAPLPVKPE